VSLSTPFLGYKGEKGVHRVGGRPLSTPFLGYTLLDRVLQGDLEFPFNSLLGIPRRNYNFSGYNPSLSTPFLGYQFHV